MHVGGRAMNISTKSYTHNSAHRNSTIICISFISLMVLIVISICVGAVKISLQELWNIISDNSTNKSSIQIFHFVRLPRTLAAVLSGAALSCSGTILQTVLGNPMCSPNIIGVNSGAGLSMIIVAAFFPSSIGFAPISAFLGSMLSVTIVYLIARKTDASKLAIVLSGIAVSSIFSAFTDTIITVVPDAKVSRVDFLIGSFSGVTMDNVSFAVPYIIVALFVAFILHIDINLISLGDSTASSLGLRVNLIRIIFLIIAALLAGSAISLGGLIGFVGLIVPHISKNIIGYDHKLLLPLSAILGGGFCLFCDILARTLFAPFEAPVGIIMSLIGSPFFIWLVLTRKRRNSFD